MLAPYMNAAYRACTTALLLCLLPWAAEGARLDDEYVTWKRHWAVTEKKFEISAKRFRLNKNVRHPRPVILVHGLLVDSRFLDFGNASLAGYLAEAGFDVWNVSLRGTGRSLNPLGWGRKPWNLDDIIKDDLPTVIEYVRKAAGSADVWMVGYELGGALALAHAGTAPDPGVAGIVGIAAPMSFESPEQDGLDILLRLDRQPMLRNALLSWNSSAVNRILFQLPGFRDVLYNPRNMDPRVTQQLIDTLLIPVNPGVLEQLITALEKDEFVSADGAVSYREALSRIRVPVLLIGGAADPLAPPEALRQLHTELASEERDLMIFWPDPEEDTPYGHFDLILGRKARKEVFPLIRKWLEVQDERNR